jgi:hypothetical protein
MIKHQFISHLASSDSETNDNSHQVSSFRKPQMQGLQKMRAKRELKSKEFRNM